MKYYVRLTNHKNINEPKHSYLSYRNRSKWCKRVAEKHASEFTAKNPDYTYKLEMEN